MVCNINVLDGKRSSQLLGKETIKIILLTAFGMIIIVLLVAIIFMLIDHQLDFINSIIQELKIRG